jgi:hypothetical protein
MRDFTGLGTRESQKVEQSWTLFEKAYFPFLRQNHELAKRGFSFKPLAPQAMLL